MSARQPQCVWKALAGAYVHVSYASWLEHACEICNSCIVSTCTADASCHDGSVVACQLDISRHNMTVQGAICSLECNALAHVQLWRGGELREVHACVNQTTKSGQQFTGLVGCRGIIQCGRAAAACKCAAASVSPTQVTVLAD